MNERQFLLPRESVLAIGSLNTHIKARHEGAWGNCEMRDCSEIRFRIKHGYYPSHPRSTGTQDELAMSLMANDCALDG